MNNKLKELMELSKAVDVVCNSVEKENKEKQKIIDQKLSEKWQIIWNDIDEIVEVLKMVKVSYGFRKDFKYGFGYPMGFNNLRDQGITFVVTCEGVNVMMDTKGDWRKVTRYGSYGFDFWRAVYPIMLEALVNKWDELLPKIEKDVEEFLSKDIQRRAKECADKTKELERKLIVY